MILTKYRINTSWGYREFLEKNAEYYAFLEAEGISEQTVIEEINEPI